MSLIPYEPFRQLQQIRRELDRFFPDEFPFFKSGFPQFIGHLNVDVYETADEVVATCDIPGLEKKEDVNIDIQNNVLTISGSIHRETEVKGQQMHRQERFVGSFHRSISLPATVSTEGVTATYKNGVLEIRMPKKQDDQRKRIDIQFH